MGDKVEQVAHLIRSKRVGIYFVAQNPVPELSVTASGSRGMVAPRLERAGSHGEAMSSENDFPIVGIGASAGGLAAYKRVLEHLPTDSGAAFILIQHLDPDHESLMVDLLARHTKMRVRQAENDMALVPDTLYVIPPGKFIRLIDQGLFLDEPMQGKGVRLSIDYFFRSLAEARGEKSIGIILSGTGTDGTLGLREIKAAGGMVMVQTPEEAEYDGMPRSAIATGLVDFVSPVDLIGERLVAFLAHPYLDRGEEETGLSETAPDSFLSILDILRHQTDYDFHSYKKGTVERRIQRRMGIRQVDTLEEYLSLLRTSPEEVNLLFRDLLIGVTRFFREKDVWEAFATKVVDPLVRRKSQTGIIRAWVPGCATGEEAYTLAMTLFDRIDRHGKQIDIQVFATDLNERAIETARNGRYSSAVAVDIPDRFRSKFTVEETDALRVNTRLRETVVFATQNVISDPPFSNLDLVTCRNLMIYLELDVQKRMIEMFHFALAEGGHLLLGNSESAERPGRLFEAVDKTHRIYRRADVVRPAAGSFPVAPGGAPNRPAMPAPPRGPAKDSPIDAARRRMLDRFAPATVLVNGRFEAQYYHGPVRDYLDFPTGAPTQNLFEMVLEGLRGKLRTALNSLAGEKRAAEIEAHRVPRGDAEVSVRIFCERLPPSAASEPMYLIHFEDISSPADAEEARRAREAFRAGATGAEQGLVGALEYELQSTREDLQSTIEEMETANEELKASNEEVTSVNEELQSTNEELETSREELQSLNEELSTVNGQLEDKIIEVEAANNDLHNLLTSTNIAVIFLDTELLIRRFTPAIKEIMRIIDGDAGRPVEDIAMRVKDDALLEDARRCLRDLCEVEAEVATDDGRHLIRRVRPYRTNENRIDGVVVTFTDVTKLRQATESARSRESQQGAVAELGRLALEEYDLDELFQRAVLEVSRRLDVRFVKILQLEPGGKTLLMRSGVGWADGAVGTARVGSGAESQAGYTLLRAHPVVVNDFAEEKRFTAPDLLKEHGIRCGASVTIGPVAEPWGVLGAHESDTGRCGFELDDVNFLYSISNVLWLSIARAVERQRVEDDARRLRQLTDALPVEVSIVGADLRYELLNEAHGVYGVDPSAKIGAPVREVIGPEAARTLEAPFEAVLAGETRSIELPATMPQSGEIRHLIVNLVPRRDDAGDVTGVISAAMDITERRHLEQELERSNRLYQTIGEAIPFGVWITDAQGELLYVSQSFLDLTGMSFAEMTGRGWVEALPPERRADMLAAWLDCCRSGADWQAEHEIVSPNGDTAHVLAIGRPVTDAGGRIENWVGLNIDITQRRREEQRLEVVSAELDHRVKNILATVSTIARVTGRSARSLEQYRAGLEARLQALAAAHQALAEESWTGMDLEELLRLELDAYHGGGSAVELRGPRLKLQPRAAQTLVLAFHELATNAAKYGALSRDRGLVRVDWDLASRNGSARTLRVSWRESGAPPSPAEQSLGFGTTVLTKVVPSQLDATAELRFGENGLEYDLILPEDSLA